MWPIGLALFTLAGVTVLVALVSEAALPVRQLRRRVERRGGGAGLSAGVTAILAAAHGEYKGTGRTVADPGRVRRGAPIGLIFVIESASVIIQVASKRLRGRKVFLSGPVHHHLEAIGWTEPKVVMRFWVISGITAVAGLVAALVDIHFFK